MVLDEFERKGHRFVTLDVVVLADGDLVQRVTHTAIHTPRRRKTNEGGGAPRWTREPRRPASRLRRSWVVVLAAFVSTFTVFGVAYSFGAFFDSMSEEFDTGKSATALMFSITTCWYFLLGLVSGKAADRFGPRPVLLVGAVLLTAGLLATSRVESIWFGYATYGVLVGSAVACGYVPMVATAVAGSCDAAPPLGIAVAASVSARLSPHWPSS